MLDITAQLEAALVAGETVTPDDLHQARITAEFEGIKGRAAETIAAQEAEAKRITEIKAIRKEILEHRGKKNPYPALVERITADITELVNVTQDDRNRRRDWDTRLSALKVSQEPVEGVALTGLAPRRRILVDEIERRAKGISELLTEILTAAGVTHKDWPQARRYRKGPADPIAMVTED